MTGLQWILPASSGWSDDPSLQSSHYLPYLRGTLGFAIRRGEVPGLKDFFLKIRPDNDPGNKHDGNMVSMLSNFVFKLFPYLNYIRSPHPNRHMCFFIVISVNDVLHSIVSCCI